MTDPMQNPMGLKAALMVARDVLVSIGIGWSASLGALWFFRAGPPENAEPDRFNDFLSFLVPFVWITVGGLAYALILHFHANRERSDPGIPH